MNDSPEYHEEVSASHLTRNKDEQQSPGEILREARCAHDYSIEDLCAQTKLAPRTVQALEDNDFDALSQPVFARGYYRQCAKVLDIDSERLMAAYSAWADEPPTPRPASPAAMGVIPQDVTPSHRRRGLGLIVLLLVLLAAIAGAFVFLPGTALLEDDASANDSAIILSDKPTIPSSASGAAGDAENAGSRLTDNGNAEPAQPQDVAPAPDRPAGGRTVSDSLNASTSTGDADRASQDDTGTAPRIAPNHLKLKFSDRSWADVRDANDARLLAGIYESGETREFDAETPYSITLGYAPGVQVFIGGDPVDVAARTTDNSTARLTVKARAAN